MDDSKVRALEDQTQSFAVATIKLQRALKDYPELWDVARQLSRAANSVAANHRAMTRARSTREFAAKLHTVHEEADESAHWLGVIKGCETTPHIASRVAELLSEAVQLRNLFGHARATTRRRYFSK